MALDYQEGGVEYRKGSEGPGGSPRTRGTSAYALQGMRGDNHLGSVQVEASGGSRMGRLADECAIRAGGAMEVIYFGYAFSSLGPAPPFELPPSFQRPGLPPRPRTGKCIRKRSTAGRRATRGHFRPARRKVAVARELARPRASTKGRRPPGPPGTGGQGPAQREEGTPRHRAPRWIAPFFSSEADGNARLASRFDAVCGPGPRASFLFGPPSAGGPISGKFAT